jgi:hypothetical protein
MKMRECQVGCRASSTPALPPVGLHRPGRRRGPGAVAFQVTVHWGELEPLRRKLLSGFDRRKHLLLQFPPANTGRHPGGFSGAGAWYQAPSSKPPEVWSFRPVLAGMITHFYTRPKLLRITRVESLVAFLQTVA